MFTRKPSRMLALAVMVAAAALVGCRRPPDPAEYGEIITEVPERLSKPFPLPELEKPEEKTERVGK